jgi:hypothetical protein
MSDFKVLTAVRGHLLNERVASRIHLALPPKAIYPLILLELEEIWSPYPLKGSEKRKAIQARVKFKASVFSHAPGMEEAALLSDRMRRILEGVSLWLPGGHSEDRTATLRFLACVSETPGNVGAGQRTKIIHHFYDSIIRE